MSKEIPLSQGRLALVDDADYAELSQHKWFVDHYGYAVRNFPRSLCKTRDIRMHRVILNAPDGMTVDHINGNRLDNRRCNLRLATDAQNKCNVGRRATNTSCRKSKGTGTI